MYSGRTDCSISRTTALCLPLPYNFAKMAVTTAALVSLVALVASASATCDAPPNPNVIASTCDGKHYNFSSLRPKET